jgi:RNA polymerase sigma factor for flagellar operon FliA
MSELLVNYPSRWAACAAGNVAARDALLQDNLSLVHYVAKQLSRSMSADADPDEMVNIGTLGLMSALETFDESRGLAFSTYAVPRIRGAILDELRRQDHVPRSIRRKTRDIAHARETAEVLGISESRVSQIRSKALAALRGIMRPMRASA